MFQPLYSGRLFISFTLTAMALLAGAQLSGCGRTGVDPTEKARFREQFLVAQPPQEFVTVAEIWTQLNGADSTAGTASAPAAGDPATNEAPSTSGASDGAAAAPASDKALPATGERSLENISIKAALAPVVPDLAAAIASYPWDDGGAAFYVADFDEHAHDGHDADCPFCAARQAKAAAMGQLIKVRLVDAQGQPVTHDLRPYLELTGTETLYLTGALTLEPNGLMHLDTQQLHVER